MLGRTIESALKRGAGMQRAGSASAFSFDMLGEGARTQADAVNYAEAYAHAIDAVGADASVAELRMPSAVSVKLSALHPRYEARQEARVFAELYPRILDLARRAKAHNIGLTLDAEEADRLVISLKLFERLAAEPSLAGWSGLGLAVQAYQKRTRAVIAKLAALARRRGTPIQVRLVKGAYWDGEIKRAQMAGRPDFPVFTTKAATDAHYLACARDLIAAADAIYPQFATHNAHTVAAVKRMADVAGVKAFEFQRLHGMGEALYAALGNAAPCVCTRQLADTRSCCRTLCGVCSRTAPTPASCTRSWTTMSPPTSSPPIRWHRSKQILTGTSACRPRRYCSAQAVEIRRGEICRLPRNAPR